MPSRHRLISLAKKLLNLSRSPNEHEAARARERAVEFMVKHGIREEDVAEAVLEVVDDHGDRPRLWLAQFTSRFFGVAVVASKRHGLGFRGPASRVTRAATLYRGVVDDLKQSALPPIASWLQSQSRVIWEFHWWEGFGAGLSERFPTPPPPPASEPEVKVDLPPDLRAEPPEPAPAAGDLADPLVSVQANEREIGPRIDMRWLKNLAREAGRAASTRVSVIGDGRIALPAASPAATLSDD